MTRNIWNALTGLLMADWLDPHYGIRINSIRSGRRKAPGQSKKKKKEATSCKRQASATIMRYKKL
jgi:hypothetical protein